MSTDGESEIGTKRHRSPNYPAIDLKTAIDRAKQLYSSANRHPVGLEVAAKAWELSDKSSKFKLGLAALRAFGLAEYVSGGKDRMVRLTELGFDIVADYPADSDGWRSSVQHAALSPALHADLRQRYGESLPADDEVRRYLVRERGFYDATVNEFIKEYKDTISFAKLGENATITSDGEKEDDPAPVAGDWVQWTNNGQEQFPEPRQLRGLSDDGKWAFVDGNLTGISVEELTVVKPNTDTKPAVSQLPAQPALAPANPFFKAADAATPLAPGEVEEKKIFDEGPAILRWPDKLSPESVEDFDYWMKGILRRLRRKAGLPQE